VSFGFQNDNFVEMDLHSASSEGNETSIEELLSVSTVSMNAINEVLVPTPVNYFCSNAEYFWVCQR
jgi:hypothetical protein